MHPMLQTHANTEGQITPGVFKHLQSKQEFSLSQLCYLLHAREGREERFSQNQIS